jgi:hypothetical protein
LAGFAETPFRVAVVLTVLAKCSSQNGTRWHQLAGLASCDGRWSRDRHERFCALAMYCDSPARGKPMARRIGGRGKTPESR